MNSNRKGQSNFLISNVLNTYFYFCYIDGLEYFLIEKAGVFWGLSLELLPEKGAWGARFHLYGS